MRGFAVTALALYCVQLRPGLAFTSKRIAFRLRDIEGRKRHGFPEERVTTLRSSDTKDHETISPLRSLYPASSPIENGTISVDSIHTIYYEMHGRNDSSTSDENDKRTPILNALFLHGGPGSGCFPNHARFFNQDHYRVVLLDQRGSGRSTPLGEVRNNTLRHLIEDCEVLRAKLQIDKWDVVLGGSWGSTLAIAYAQTYPRSIGSMVLRGVCLLRAAEVDWLFSNRGAAIKINATAWRHFEQAITGSSPSPTTDEDQRRVLHEYYDTLLGCNETQRSQAAFSWMKFESMVSSSSSPNQLLPIQENSANITNNAGLLAVRGPGMAWSYVDGTGRYLTTHEINVLGLGPPEQLLDGMQKGLGRLTTPGHDRASIHSSPRPFRMQYSGNSSTVANRFVAQAMLTCFYSANDKFAMDNIELLAKDRISTIQDIPCIAIQGGMDHICPIDTALQLKELWPSLELRIPLNASHSMYHPAITNEIVQATDLIAQVLLKSR